MKKLILTVLMAVGFAPAFAEYQSMQFDTLAGETYTISLTDLDIRFDNGNLTATGGGHTLVLPLDQMKTMQFSEEEAAIESLTINSECPAEVYDLKGVSLGKFSSLEQINDELPAGIYIVRQADGLISKIVLL